MGKTPLMKSLIKWEPQKISLVGAAAGSAIALLSIAMTGARDAWLLSIFIRDILMILAVGIFVPLSVMKKEGGFKEYGLHTEKWFLYLPINLLLGVLLLVLFLKEVPLPADFVLGADIVWQIVYILLAGVFETIAFYSFVRTTVERSFGIIPGILAAAAFYSLHHAGFQPEFGKLFFVGVMYAAVFRTGDSALLVFPFFWGVGGCYDVLVQSTVVAEIRYPMARSLILAIGMALIAAALFARRGRPIRPSMNAPPPYPPVSLE